MRTADSPPKEPLCTVALRISSLNDALEWWGATMGASVQQEYDATSGETPAYKVALVGWGKELLSPQLELRQTHPPPEQSLTGFVRVVIGTESLTRTAEALVAPGKAAEAVEIGSLGNAQDTEPGLRVEDPDGWEVCFVEKPAARMQEV
jgi:catechol 2,3-dioxygenase-like lactoylglutathione lyase family enzyme